MRKNLLPSVARQSGVVMVTALILLVVMTLLAVSSVRVVTQQERMAGYSYDRGLAFQAAEAALRSAEAGVEELKPTVAAGTCEVKTSGLLSLTVCGEPGATETRWTNSGHAGWTASTTVGTGTLSITPQYMVEYLGTNFPCNADLSPPNTCKRYRITARAGGSDRATAMVQSMYATD